MKSNTAIKFILILTISIISSNVFGNTIESGHNPAGYSKIQTSQQKQITQQTRITSDSLPKGVTKDWLHGLKDETGRNIIPDEGDALQTNGFTGNVGTFQYGYSVKSAGDVNGDGYDDIIIGEPLFASNKGKAFIYFGSVTINTAADVTLNGESANNYFGSSVSSAGDVNGDGYDDVIIGAYGYSSNTGRAYIFFGGSSMNSVADIIMTGESVNSNFGISVSDAGDVNNDGYSDVIAGASGYNSNTGRSYVFLGGTGMDNTADAIMNGTSINNYFGYSVSDAGNVNGDSYDDVIIGAYGASGNRGRAYIFYGASTMDNISDVNIIGQLGAYAGRCVSGAGDVNNDGYSDVIISSDFNSANIGTVNLYFGSAGMDNLPDVTFTEGDISYYFGSSVCSAGDVNGDGYDDIAVGSKDYYFGTGRIFIYFGGASVDAVADIIKTGESANSFLGNSVSGAGDFNGDGYSDIIAGSFGWSGFIGKAYLYTYGVNEFTADLTMTEEAAGGDFGYSVSTAGDVNGDGFADVIVGDPGYDINKGRAYIFFGGLIMDNVADVVFTGSPSPADQLGFSVSDAGDVNGDGYSDVIVGAPYWHANNLGQAYIYYGGISMDITADVIFTGDSINNHLGYSVSSAGDVNGDGYSDVIVGVPDHSHSTGNANIYFGGVAMNNTVDVILKGEHFDDVFGFSVSAAGDVNGDSYSDVIVGAPFYDGVSNIDIGRTYIFLGNVSMNNIPDIVMTGDINGHLGERVCKAGDINNDGYSDVLAYELVLSNSKIFVYLGGLSMDNIPDVTINRNLPSYRSISLAGDVNGDGFSDIIAAGEIYFGGRNMDNISDANIDNNSAAGNAGDLNGDGLTDLIEGSSSIGKSFIYFSMNKVILYIKVIPEGFYNATSNKLNMRDTVTACLRNAFSPYNILYSAKSIIDSVSMTGKFIFTGALAGTYFIYLNHRNSIEIWSAGPVNYSQTISSGYDFTSSSGNAYGNNVQQVDASPVRFGIFSGDVNQDGVVDLTDMSMIDNDASFFVSGYIKTDLNGDNFIDLADLAIADNNAFNFVANVMP